MRKVLNKRILRDLKANFFRYTALFLLIVLGMFIVVSMVAAAETIIVGTENNGIKNNIEDGQFSTFLPLTTEQEKIISDMGVTLENEFSVDVNAQSNTVIRFMKNRKNVNLIELDNGKLAENNNEIVLEKRYSEDNELLVGDWISVSNADFLIVGIGTVPDYDLPLAKYSDMAANSKAFGIGFVTAEQYQIIAENNNEEYTYAYKINGNTTLDELKQTLKSFEFNVYEIQNEYFKEALADKIASGLDFSKEKKLEILTSFILAENNPRIKAGAGDVLMNKQVGLLAGVIVMVLFTYVISVFVIHQVNLETSVIGSLYALGAKKKELLIHYITLPVIISFLGGVVGLTLAFSPIGIENQMSETYGYFSMPVFDKVYPLYLIIYSVIVPPLICAVVNYIVINKKLSATALSLIKNEQDTKAYNKIKLKSKNFIRNFQFTQMLKETRTSLTIIIGLIISLCIFMLGFNCLILVDNIAIDTENCLNYNFMYMLKYPEKTTPENAEKCFTETLTKEQFGFTSDITIMGVINNSAYFNYNIPNKENNVVIGKSIAEKYSVKEGDKLTLLNNVNDKEYTFEIDSICDYSIGLTVFMSIENMQTLFDEDDDYYNTLISNTMLEIDEGRLYSTITYDDIISSTTIFTEMMLPLIITLTISSIIIIFVVMFLMLNVMLDRASFGISIVKIFGYNRREIKKLYINGNLYTVVLGTIIAIPIAKKTIDLLYPYLIANVACGMNLHFPFYSYVLIFVCIILAYFIINKILTFKLNKISAADVLKNRE